ncbi:unnamed protein product [Didymodactylos carnosus]|uniref:Uncharacterized protein n=1 Tax=Didymodactylos carnosus TaxID=1234261 RepID=A0A815C8S7_9BILA|nr:unnamed protein product [Didymodactylos carnosus]CAF4081704.1 unnamed protein product [Didymodactylos carnosus]
MGGGLLKLGPRFIFNDPRTAARRRTIELATLKRKLEQKFYEKKVCPGRPDNQSIADLDLLLQKLHDVPMSPRRSLNNSNDQQFILEISSQLIIPGQSSKIYTKKKNYGRLVKRLKHKFRLNNIILQKTDKSKVFHLGKLEDCQKKSEKYMAKTKAYRCLGVDDPLPDFNQRTNKYLLELRLDVWGGTPQKCRTLSSRGTAINVTKVLSPH